MLLGGETKALDPLRGYRSKDPPVDVVIAPVHGPRRMAARLVTTAKEASHACKTLGARAFFCMLSLAAGLTLGAGRGKAQAPDFAEVSMRSLASTVPQGAGGEQTTAYDVAVNVPVPLAERSLFFPGIAYHVDAVSFQDAEGDFDETTPLHALDATLLFLQLLPRNWSLSLRGSVGLGGDGLRFTRGAYRFNALALASHGFGDTFVLGGGALATYRFGQFLVLPALFLQWDPLAQLGFEMFVPAYARAVYRPHSRVEIAARFDFGGNSYAIRRVPLRDQFPCTGNVQDNPVTDIDERVPRPDECLNSVAYTTGTIGVSIAVRLFSTVWLNIAGGYSVFRMLVRTNSEGHDFGPNHTFPNTGFVQVGLTWRLPTEENDDSP
ncbi:MAG: DUF6268 family outer membrane beta-barrel protein [Myxococcota bacterium]